MWNQIFHKVVWQHAQGVVGVLNNQLYCKFTRKSASERRILKIC